MTLAPTTSEAKMHLQHRTAVLAQRRWDSHPEYGEGTASTGVSVKRFYKIVANVILGLAYSGKFSIGAICRYSRRRRQVDSSFWCIGLCHRCSRCTCKALSRSFRRYFAGRRLYSQFGFRGVREIEHSQLERYLMFPLQPLSASEIKRNQITLEEDSLLAEPSHAFAILLEHSYCASCSW